MPKYVGLTIDEAIQKGLNDLAISRDEAEIIIVDEGKKGFLGMGRKDAMVTVDKKIVEPVLQSVEIVETMDVVKEEIVSNTSSEEVVLEEVEVLAEAPLENLDDQSAIEELKLYLTQIIEGMDIPVEIHVRQSGKTVIFNLESDKQGLLIGKHGKILNALQYLAQVFIHRVAKNKISVVVDAGDYRKKREEIINRLAKNTAEKVKRTGEPVILEPMSAYERKQVHSILSKDPHIKTHSEGEEPYRYLIVEYEKNVL